MADEAPRAAIVPRQARKPARVVQPAPQRPRAPFLPNEPHPHGWLAKHHGQRPHALVTDEKNE
jgi:hypothetical protein